jgi:fibronectin type 3 domain-containing protein
MLTKRSMLIVLALLLAPFVLTGCGNDKTTSPIIETPDTVPPAAPATRVSRSDYGFATVMWQRNTEADLAGYYVYQYNPTPDSEKSYQRLNTQTYTGTGYKVEGLTPGMTYYFKITAVDRSGNESAYSATLPLTVMSRAAGGNDDATRDEYLE